MSASDQLQEDTEALCFRDKSTGMFANGKYHIHGILLINADICLCINVKNIFRRLISEIFLLLRKKTKVYSTLC
jgi:hypothetical protein